MQISFYCQHCNQLVSTSGQQAGLDIACPRCGRLQVAARENGPWERDRPKKEHDSIITIPAARPPAALVSHEAAPAPILSADDPKPSPVPGSAAPPSPAPLVPSDMILFPRRMFYVQAALFPIVAGLAMAAGYWMGRGNAASQQESTQKNEAHSRVPVDGTIVYDPGTGRPAGDDGATILIVPAGKYPTGQLRVEALRPSYAPPPETHHALSQIRQFGGAYARADAAGQFSMFVPDRGKYWVLILSRHVSRPENAPPRESDLAEMGKYFEGAARLVESLQYRWTLEEINLGSAPIQTNFGRAETTQ